MKPQSDSVAETVADPARLAALRATGLMDSPAEPDFDRVTRLVQRALGVDVSLVSLVDESRQFFKSACGLPGDHAGLTGTPLSHSFCQYVVGRQAALEVTDARQDLMLKDNLAIRDLNVIGYLGVPIRGPDSQFLGSLCAIQKTPRAWTERERAVLEDCAGIVEDLVAQRTLTLGAVSLAHNSDTLAREFSHRVKNLIAVVQALVRLSKRESATIEEFSAAIDQRLRAYASAHDAMALSGGAVDLEAVLSNLVAPYEQGDQSITIAGPDHLLWPDHVMPICLIVHELATNSAKHGALSRAQLPVLAWTREDGILKFAWREAFVAADNRPGDHTPGFGTKLLSYAARQLDGELSRAIVDGEFRVEWSLPVNS